MEKRSTSGRAKSGDAVVDLVAETDGTQNTRHVVGPRGQSVKIATASKGFTQFNIYTEEGDAEIVLTWVDHNGVPWKEIINIVEPDHSIYEYGVYKGARVSITNQSQTATLVITISSD